MNQNAISSVSMATPLAMAEMLIKSHINCIPCKGKQCSLPGWKSYQNVPIKPDKIKEWWTITPKNNVAIITGEVSDLTVVDVDNCGHSPEILKRLISIFGHTNIFVESPGGNGGYHLYYRYNGECIKKYSIEGFTPDEFYIFTKLRFSHWDRNEFVFVKDKITHEVLPPHSKMGKLKLRKIMAGLEAKGYIKCTYKGGKQKGDASRYAWGSKVSII